jgi:hypothetical protein
MQYKAQSELLAHLLDKLKSTREPDGSTLFDHTTVVYGSNIRTGHSLDNCPTLLAGRGAGICLGQNILAPKDTPPLQRLAHCAPGLRCAGGAPRR